MKTLFHALNEDIDAGMLPALAKFWKVILVAPDRETATRALSEIMLDPVKAEVVWDGLKEDQRGALQMLVSVGGKMPMSKFGRLFGEIRPMGTAQIEREKPLENPQSVSEALYYRGLIAQLFEISDTGPRVMVYIPSDLAAALPLRKTSYSNLEPEMSAAGAAPLEPIPLVEALEDVTGIRAADTSIVDDLTTLLAYVQIETPTVTNDRLNADDWARLKSFLLRPEEDRLTFVFKLALSSDLLEFQNGRAYPNRAGARRWLEQKRSEQVRLLAEAWRESALVRDLWHVPGLYPEPGGELDEYDAAAVRANALDLMGELLPASDWWSLESFIQAVKETDADFQRPGDYESWYIRNEAGDFLTGFESWEAVEGALLEHYILGPLHWLGLVDHADEAARLTAYGRGYLKQSAWPAPPDPDDKISMKDDGTLLVSRKIARVDRFQVARFTTWGAAGDPYQYRLDGAGIQQAAEQGITLAHITSFLGRAMGDTPLPPAVKRLFDQWERGPSATVTLENVTVLRTTAPETLDRIYETPTLRRYLGARMGPMAVLVRPGQQDGLRAALVDAGIAIEALE